MAIFSANELVDFSSGLKLPQTKWALWSSVRKPIPGFICPSIFAILAMVFICVGTVTQGHSIAVQRPGVCWWIFQLSKVFFMETTRQFQGNLHIRNQFSWGYFCLWSPLSTQLWLKVDRTYDRTILKIMSPMGAIKQHPQMVCGRVSHIVF